MKIHEYQAKKILHNFGVPIPKGQTASNANEAKQIATELGGRVIVKAQVLVSGRGKAGGIRLAKSAQEAYDLASDILSMEINNLPVHKLLVDEAVNIARELYIAITYDRSIHCPIIMASAEGGVNIEEIAQQSPDKIITSHIDPLIGLCDYQTRHIAWGIDLPKEYWRSFTDILHGLWHAYHQCDATLIEINPLVISGDQRLLCLDAKIILDDSALYRHKDLAEMRDVDAEDPLEAKARKYGLSYVKLSGDIGCMVNGAGLAMATMDLVKLSGGKPANFLDIGGGATAERVATALKILLSDLAIKVILINIFGGITRCDDVAKGILSVLSETSKPIPIIVRLVGTNSDEGMNLLKNSPILMINNLFEASQTAIKLAKQQGVYEHTHQ